VQKDCIQADAMFRLLQAFVPSIQNLYPSLKDCFEATFRSAARVQLCFRDNDWAKRIQRSL
jgi:hypothetical protein